MKNFIILIMIFGFLISCNKQKIKPNYVSVSDEVVDTTAWNVGYVNGGTLPNTNNNSNNLVNTTWILIKITSAFSTTYPNDTIYFVDNTHYTLNGGAIRNYQINNIIGSTNRELSLYYFAPFGGSHYSGQIGFNFINDGELNNILFEDMQNQNSIVRAWLIKI